MTTGMMNAQLGTSLKARFGNMPLLGFERLTRGMDGVQVLAKAEWTNPGGSVKDRAASNIVTEALQRGDLGSGRTLLDSTSGNTGIAYAMIGAAYGITVTLCVPSNVSRSVSGFFRRMEQRLCSPTPAKAESERDDCCRTRKVLLCGSVFQ